MNTGVYVVYIHLDAIDRLGNRAGIIRINPINLVEHHFDLIIGHLADIADHNAVFKGVDNHLGKMVALCACYDASDRIGNKISKCLCTSKILFR